MQRPSAIANFSRQTIVRWICMILAMGTVLLYLPVGHFEFNNFDDAQYLTQNPEVQRGLTAHSVAWAFTTGYAANWHPVTWLSHLLDVELFRFDAGQHHLVNLLFHVLNTILLFLFLGKWTGFVWRSAVVAALFAWHPMHVESVAWVAERKDVLSTFFWLLVMHSYARFTAGGIRASSWYIASLVLFALGLMSKPMLVSLPLVLLLMDVWPLKRIQWPFALSDIARLVIEKIPFIAMSVALCVVTLLVQKHGGAVQSLENLPLAERVGNVLVSYVHYVEKLFWPVDLAVLYPKLHGISLADVVISGLLLLTISIALLARIRKHAFAAFGWFWFCITLVPVIGIVQVGEQSMADRYTYIPSIGLFVLVVWGAMNGAPLIASAAAIFVLTACLAATRHQLKYWHDSIALFTRAVDVTKDNFMAECDLGLAYSEKGMTNEAIIHETRAVRINPLYPEAQDNLGVLLEGQRDWDKAREHLLAALQARTNYDSAEYNLGMLEYDQNHLDAAVTNFRAAIAMNPRNDKALVNLGIALARLGHPDEAMAQYREAVNVAPFNAYAHNALGSALQSRNLLTEAAAQYGEAIQCRPDFASAYENLGTVLMLQAQIPQAVDAFQKALQFQPQNVAAHFNLAILLTRLGQTEGAADHYRQVLRIEPGNEQARAKLAALTGEEPSPQ